MRFEAPHRSIVACLTCVALLALAGCGNRGELYLASSADAEAELRALEGAGAADDAALVPDEAVAPTVAPGPALDPGVEPDEERKEDEDDGS